MSGEYGPLPRRGARRERRQGLSSLRLVRLPNPLYGYGPAVQVGKIEQPTRPVDVDADQCPGGIEIEHHPRHHLPLPGLPLLKERGMAFISAYTGGEGVQTWAMPPVLLALLVVSHLTRPASRRLGRSIAGA